MARASVIPALLICYGLVAETPAPEKLQKLSLQDAIKISLQNNLQVEIAQQTKIGTEAGLLNAQGSFDWLLTSGLTYARSDFGTNRASSPLQAPLVTSGTSWNRDLTVGVQKPFEWGGALQVNYHPTYSYSRTFVPAHTSVGGVNPATGKYDPAYVTQVPDTTSPTFYPYSGSMSATYTQSLLKGFGREATETSVIVARKTTQAAQYQYQLSIINLVASTESQYWDLVYARQSLDNAKIALALAQKQLNENKIRVEVGTLAPIEVTSAEAAVALQEQNIIAAEAALQNANDALIRALYPNAEHPDQVEPTDAPNLSHTVVEEAKGEQMALDRRVELKIAKLDLESKGVLKRAAENRLKPQLDAFATYNGSSDNYTSLSPVNTDLTSRKYPGYAVGLNFSLPITNRAAKGSLSQARANERSSELTLQDQKLAIQLQVRQAFRNIDAAEKGVDAAKKTRIFREKDLDAEQKKFENGMSTNFLVLSKQNDLNSARSAEVQAQINYAKAVTTLEQAMGNLLEARSLSYPN